MIGCGGMSNDSRPYVLSEICWPPAELYPVAVLPWGATEAHNRHLPYGTDTIMVERVAHEAARIAWDRGARPIVLPAIPLGVQTGQADIPLCLNMNPSTQASLLADLAASLEPHGVRSLVVLNGHGGNEFRSIVRELQPRTGVFLCVANWWKAADHRVFAEPGDHAGELETSVMMHVAPELVRTLESAGRGAERRMKPRAFRDGWAWAPRRWSSATADTGIGDPRASTAENGRAFFDEAARSIAGLIVDLANTTPESLYEESP